VKASAVRAKVVCTGSSGRIGRAIMARLTGIFEVVGVDRVAGPATTLRANIADEYPMRKALEGADAVIHTAGPHAPHVGKLSEAEFERAVVADTAQLFDWARAAGVRRFVFASTTALYGHAIVPGTCTWIDETTPPSPRTIYHRTKLAAERRLEAAASRQCSLRVLRIGRCFPETAPLMTVYRLHRGIDTRDVAEGHVRALSHRGAPFERFVLSGATPFLREDAEMLGQDAPHVLRRRARALVAAFERRGWALPTAIDRVYDAAKAQRALGWTMRHDWREVIAQAERSDEALMSRGRSEVCDA
jgi:nucleoside-diphosphate-sugar epimerase